MATHNPVRAAPLTWVRFWRALMSDTIGAALGLHALQAQAPTGEASDDAHAQLAEMRAKLVCCRVG